MLNHASNVLKRASNIVIHVYNMLATC